MVRTKRSIISHKIARYLRQAVYARRTPFVYVAIGDSTVEGVGASQLDRTYASLVSADVSRDFKNTIHYNYGKSGARAEDVLNGQLSQTIAAHPDLVTLSVGANDILRHTKLHEFRQHLTRLIDELQTRTHALIVISNIPNFSLLHVVPVPLKPVATYRIRRFNACIWDIASSRHLVHIDAYKHTTTFARQFPSELVYKDGFHPSDFGYALWANTILITLQERLAALKAERQLRHRHHLS